MSALRGAGLFFIAEGLISIDRSEDQRSIAQLGRILRIGIGAWMMLR